MGLRLDACFTVGALILVVLASNLSESEAEAARIVVGGTEHWHFGFNYSDWALSTAPFYQKDKLVFVYDPPNGKTFPRGVYLLKNLGSFQECDLRKAKLIGDPLQGGGQGLEFVLRWREPHYFACGERGGFHCKVGLMKFSVVPTRPCPR